MIQRRLRPIDEPELHRREDDDDQNRQRNRCFDERGAALPTSTFEWGCHIHVTFCFLATGVTLVLQSRLHGRIGLAFEIVITLHAFASSAGTRLEDLWRDQHDQFGLATTKLA